MTFTPEQIEALKAPLGSSHVKTRSQAGRQLSYVEGWHAIAEANRIFGFDRWDRRLMTLKEIGEPREVDGKWRVAYLATVRISVYAGGQSEDSRETEILRDGTGYGSGIDRDVGQAHESAIKEAETDAMKRALMTFGNPFGLALYDKDQANVVDDRGPTITQQKDFDQMKAVLEGCETLADIDDRLRAFAGKIGSLTDEQKERLRGVVRFVREARKVAA